ncbi:ABC transporter permease [Paraburkholderia sp. ZP32-5]|uniref:ABC transporter permease n=1 Tax=Paraburkholderia sp. ZP32-5 TaxID=2883245 RepID=UPI001F3300DF|nr:ABC transporter permease subunit [Paraburkholderia sp. ZP32-5]
MSPSAPVAARAPARRWLRPATVRWALVIGVLALLEIACRAGFIARITMVPPSTMLDAAWQVLADPALRASVLTTLEEVLIAAALSIVVGILLGLCLFALPWLKRLADPVLSAWYAVPVFIFYPVMIVLFGIGERPIIAISFVFALASMVLCTVTALERIPRALLKTARVMRLSPAHRFIHIWLPAALPHLVVGLRLVLAYSLIGTIAGEFILSSIGIGHDIAFSYDNFMTARMYGLIVIVIAASVVLNYLLSLLTGWLGGPGRVLKGVSSG